MAGVGAGAPGARGTLPLDRQTEFLSSGLGSPEYDPNAALDGILSRDTRDFVARDSSRGPSFDMRGGGALSNGAALRAYEQTPYDPRAAYEASGIYNMRGVDLHSSYPSAASAYGFGGVEPQQLAPVAFDAGMLGGAPSQQAYAPWGGGGSSGWSDSTAMRGGGGDRAIMQAQRGAMQQARGVESSGASSMWGGGGGGGIMPLMSEDERRYRASQQQAQALAQQQQQQQHWGGLANSQQGGEAQAYGGTEGIDSFVPWGTSNVSRSTW